MGWRGKNVGMETIFGNITDSLIKQATCDLMLVKLGSAPHAFPKQLQLRHKWLIPTTGGDRINKLLTILPALTRLDYIPPKLHICQVSPHYRPQKSSADFQHAAYLLQKAMNCPIIPLLISANSVSEAIISLTQRKKYGLVILGASNEGLLQNVVKGNIPEAIARRANSTVIIFRSSKK